LLKIVGGTHGPRWSRRGATGSGVSLTGTT